MSAPALRCQRAQAARAEDARWCSRVVPAKRTDTRHNSRAGRIQRPCHKTQGRVQRGAKGCKIIGTSAQHRALPKRFVASRRSPLGPKAVAVAPRGRSFAAPCRPQRASRRATRTPSTTRSWTITDGCGSACALRGHTGRSADAVAVQRLATCSSDRVVKIFELAGDARTHLADLAGHDGPVRPTEPAAEQASSACA
jgi:hypothetical protein